MEEEKQVDNKIMTSTTPPMSPHHSVSTTPITSPKENKVTTPLSPNREDAKVSTPNSSVKKEEETKPKKSMSSTTLVDKQNETVKWNNWSIVWVKQKGYPWWPAKIILVDKLTESKKKPLTKLNQFKGEKQYLVRYLTDGYQFGWANEEQIKTFKDNFMDIIGDRMLRTKSVVEAINRAIDTTDDKLPESDISKFRKAVELKEMMRRCDIGDMVVGNSMIKLTKIEVKVERDPSQSVTNQMYSQLKNWKELEVKEVVKQLTLLLTEPFMIWDLLNPVNAVGETITEMSHSSNLEIAVLAETVFDRMKKELKYAIESGEYQRCKEFFN